MEMASVTQAAAAGEWLQGLLLQLVDRAGFDVEDLDAHPEEALHRLRLRMKKADALIRLAKGAVSKAQRQRLRAQFRQVKNAGGRQRDTVVVAKLARDLGRKRGLHLAQAPPVHTKPGVRRLQTLLTRLGRDLAGQNFARLTWEDVRDNHTAVYRSGSRRMQEAEQTEEPEAFHRWRKRVKALHYQSQALHRFLPHPRRRLHRTRRLGKLLGREQDLMLLETAALGEAVPDNRWTPLVANHRGKLRPQILKLGAKLYRQSPHRFARSVKFGDD